VCLMSRGAQAGYTAGETLQVQQGTDCVTGCSDMVIPVSDHRNGWLVWCCSLCRALPLHCLRLCAPLQQLLASPSVLAAAKPIFWVSCPAACSPHMSRHSEAGSAMTAVWQEPTCCA
jgi:hypothetical protein